MGNGGKPAQSSVCFGINWFGKDTRYTLQPVWVDLKCFSTYLLSWIWIRVQYSGFMGQFGSMEGLRGGFSAFCPKPPIGGGGGGPQPGGGGGGGGPAPGKPGGAGSGGGGGDGPLPGSGGGGGGAPVLPGRGGGGGGGGPERPWGRGGGGGGGSPAFRFSPMASRLSFLGGAWVGLGARLPPLVSGLLMKDSLSVWMLTVRLFLRKGSSAVDTATSQTLGWT